MTINAVTGSQNEFKFPRYPRRTHRRQVQRIPSRSGILSAGLELAVRTASGACILSAPTEYELGRAQFDVNYTCLYDTTIRKVK
jgi:hypothetical protein